jgi:MFS family permease
MGGRIPRNVIALGVVSLLTDLSTEMILPVLPLFVTAVLGASAASLGLIEGVAESASCLLRLLSGWLADRASRRKPLVVLGYGLSGAAKAALARAASWPAVLALRASDRLGKGLRNPPRDALIADSVEAGALGAAFGFHRALDTLGAALGPLATIALLHAFPGDFRRVFLSSALPAVLSIAVLVIFVRARRPIAAPPPAGAAGARAPLGRPFRRFLVVAALFSLANSSVAFLILRARGVGFSIVQVPLVYLAYNLVYALLSWPIGVWTDRVGRRPALLAAYTLFAVVYALLAWAASAWWVAMAFGLLGVHSALLEGSQRALVGDLVSPLRRASAYGLYYTVVGVALLPASGLAGVLWDRFGPRTTFAADAGVAVTAAALFALWFPAHRESEDRHRAQPA